MDAEALESSQQTKYWGGGGQQTMAFRSNALSHQSLLTPLDGRGYLQGGSFRVYLAITESAWLLWGL